MQGCDLPGWRSKSYLLAIKIILLTLLTLSFLGIAHAYIFYPLILKLLVRGRHPSTIDPGIAYPEITILLAAFNEEEVIEEKIHSTFDSDYPKDKIKLLIGSDNSSDATNEIVTRLQVQYPNMRFMLFKERQGKIKIMNRLASETESGLLIFTDANVFFQKNTLNELVRHFNEPRVQLVCGNIIKEDHLLQGVSQQEIYYMDYENTLKFREYIQFGFCLGAEGGCFAIRKDAFRPVPEHFLTDDFFTTMQVIRSGGRVVFERQAICREDSVGDPKVELKRKTRIQIGNMQNLVYFRHCIHPFRKLGFAFISHKILRWITPFLLILIIITSFLLSVESAFFLILGLATLCICFSPLANYLLAKCRIKLPLLNFAAHFIMMNWALLRGFFLFFRKRGTSHWQPTPRKT